MIASDEVAAIGGWTMYAPAASLGESRHSWSIPSDELLHYLLMVFMDPVSKAEFI